MSEHNDGWLCCLCKLSAGVCKCRAIHKVTGYVLMSLAGLLFLTNISVFTYIYETERMTFPSLVQPSYTGLDD